MANELVLMIETEVPLTMTCADGTGIEKGAVLKLADPFTASTSDGDTDVVAGVCAVEKIASDGVTSVSVFRGGIFKAVAGVAGVTAGHSVITDSSTSAANRLVNSDVNSENIFGVALETATTGETFLVELKPFHVNLA